MCRPARSGAPPPAVETKDTGAQSVSNPGNVTRDSQRRALTSDCGRRATNAPTCLGYRNGPRTHRGSRNDSSPPTMVVEGPNSQSVREEPGGQVKERPTTVDCWCTPLRGVWIDSTLRCMTASSVLCPDPGVVFPHLPGSTCIQAGGGMIARVDSKVNSNTRSSRGIINFYMVAPYEGR